VEHPKVVGDRTALAAMQLFKNPAMQCPCPSARTHVTTSSLTTGAGLRACSARPDACARARFGSRLAVRRAPRASLAWKASLSRAGRLLRHLLPRNERRISRPHRGDDRPRERFIAR